MNIVKKYNLDKLRFVALLVLALQLSSCNDFLDNDNEFYHVATQEQQWNSLTDTRAALFGVYGLMRSALGENNTYWAVGDLRLGDFTVRVRDDLQAIRDNKLDESYPLIQQIANWRRFYKVVNAASVFVENAGKVLEKDDAYSETNYQYDVAQVRVLRALAYFYMVRMWGDVPLLKYSYDNGTFPEVPRTDVEIVLKYVKDELKAVAPLLPELLGAASGKYYGGDADKWRGWLLNRYSAYAILAHVSAWEGNYVDVETYAGYVWDNAEKIKAACVPIEDLVGPTGIFSVSYANTNRAARLVTFGYNYESTEVNESTVDGHLESWTLADPIISKALPDIFISKDSLVKIFMQDATGDTRFGFDETGRYYTNYIKGLNLDIPVFSKINVLRDGKGTTSDHAVFGSFIILSRMEDMALLRAEALTMLNRSEDAVAYLNTVRNLRGLVTLSYEKDLSKGGAELLLKEIFNERRRELMGEGHYWFDQIRRARILGDNPEMVELVNSGKIYWPVADDVLKANPEITQNECWK